MDFRKYSSLENGYRQAFVNKAHMLGVHDWVALEKVHGANFQFATDGQMFTVGKRTQNIGQNAFGDYDFYGCNDIVWGYKPKVFWLVDLHLIKPEDHIIVYGELFGNGIQKEVKYGDKDFIAFDIFHNDSWMDWEVVVAACNSAGIPHTPEIGRGTLEQLLDISPSFRSLLTPVDHVGDNFSEGFVIKQLKNEQLLPNGSRAAIKVKNDKFKENKGTAKKAKQAPAKLTEEQEQLHLSMSTYLTENRLRNVLSKIGEVTQRDFGKIQGLFVADAKGEYERDELDENPVDKDAWNAIKKSYMNLGAEIVRKNFLNIIDGTF